MSVSFNSLLSLFQKLHKQKNPKSLGDVAWHYAPYAVGFNNNGLIIPTSEILQGNAAVDRWIDMMQFYDVSHLHYWYDTCHNYPITMEIYDMMQAIGTRGCQEHSIPFIEYIPRPEAVIVRSGTMLELIHLFNLATVGEFMSYLYSIAVFGIFLNDYIANEVLMIQNIQEFMAARLFQGEIDAIMGGIAMGIRSSESQFMEPYSQEVSTYDSTPFYQSIEGEITKDEFNQLLMHERQKIMTSTYLGNDTEQVIAMKEVMKLSDTYGDYISKRGPVDYPKVGPQVYESIALGTSTRKEVIYSPPDRLEVHPAAYADYKSRIAKINKDSRPKETLPQLGAGQRVPIFGPQSGGGVNSQDEDSKNRCVIS